MVNRLLGWECGEWSLTTSYTFVGQEKVPTLTKRKNGLAMQDYPMINV